MAREITPSSTRRGRTCRADRSIVPARPDRYHDAPRSRVCSAGLALAIVLVYLLIVVNFQSWLDPFIIISALPARAGRHRLDAVPSHTTISVPSLTGAIMCMGVATANSILVVSFAKERAAPGDATAVDAASTAGFTRLRPVLMTALAMIIGMVPMALGLGEGGEQNAPLGRAGHRRTHAGDGGDADLRAHGLCDLPRQTTRATRRSMSEAKSGRRGPIVGGMVLTALALGLAFWGFRRGRGRWRW